MSYIIIMIDALVSSFAGPAAQLSWSVLQTQTLQVHLRLHP